MRIVRGGWKYANVYNVGGSDIFVEVVTYERRSGNFEGFRDGHRSRDGDFFIRVTVIHPMGKIF